MPDNRKPLIYGAFPVCRNYTVRAHLRHHGPAKRRGCKNRVLDARSLLRRLHAGHLRPRHHRRTAQGGANDGQYPIPCCLMVSAIRSRWGQRLGQKKQRKKTTTYANKKTRNLTVSGLFVYGVRKRWIFVFDRWIRTLGFYDHTLHSYAPSMLHYSSVRYNIFPNRNSQCYFSKSIQEFLLFFLNVSLV